MALLNHLHQEPPDGYKFLSRESGLWIRAELFEELVAQVIAHRQHKGIAGTERGEVELEIQRQICAGAAPNVCHAEPGEDYRPFADLARTLSLAKIEAFSGALIAWLKAGMRMVPPAESAARAATCRGCPFNKTASACVCTTFFKAIDAMVPAGRNEPDLQICTLCGCSLRVKVLAPMEVVREGNPPDLRLPQWCWQN